MSGITHHPSSLRNVKVLTPIIKRIASEICSKDKNKKGLRCLSVAEGTGIHVSSFASAVPTCNFFPTEYTAELIPVINATCKNEKCDNVASSAVLDASSIDQWSALFPEMSTKPTFDFGYAINVIHISPWAVTEGIFNGFSHLIKDNGILLTYGAYQIGETLEPESNRSFDASLRARDPRWGIRRLERIKKLASENCFVLEEKINCPANNYALLWRRQARIEDVEENDKKDVLAVL
eukprot:g1461.t1